VTGNHDHYSRAAQWADAACGLGMCVLGKVHTRIDMRRASFDLAVVDGHRSGIVDGARENLPRALKGREPAPGLAADRRSLQQS